MFKTLKKISPSFLYPYARKIRFILFSYIDSKKPYLNKMAYKGFDLYYTRGAGLIERIRFGNPNREYEPELIAKIEIELKKGKNPCFVDIGSNIGLISLAVLKAVPDAIIYAFEPSPAAFKSFFTTIFSNRLENKIRLSEVAVSNKNGEMEFSVHSDRDSSGDGLVDTGRAESAAHSIKRKVVTLDAWWEENNKPKISVIKIDIEGAELWALEGATTCIDKNKPVIFLEISVENLKAYPHSAMDVFVFFDTHRYQLSNLEGKQCTEKNILEMVKNYDTFIATPRP